MHLPHFGQIWWSVSVSQQGWSILKRNWLGPFLNFVVVSVPILSFKKIVDNTVHFRSRFFPDQRHIKSSISFVVQYDQDDGIHPSMITQSTDNNIWRQEGVGFSISDNYDATFLKVSLHRSDGLLWWRNADIDANPATTKWYLSDILRVIWQMLVLSSYRGDY